MKKINVKFHKYENEFTDWGQKGVIDNNSYSCHYNVLKKDNDELFIMFAKTNAPKQIFVGDDGKPQPLTEPTGQLFYALINTKDNIIMSFAVNGGNTISLIKEWINNESSSVRINPLLIENIKMKALTYDYFKSIHVGFKFDTQDDVAEFAMTKEGSQLSLLNDLDGYCIDCKISTRRNKQVLNRGQIQEMMNKFLDNDFCTKVVLRGGNWELGEGTEQHNLVEAKVTYQEEVELDNGFLDSDRAYAILCHAYQSLDEK